MTPRRLRHFLALVEHAHFGRAAQALAVSQPALSKSLQALECELGVQLLERRSGGVTLTAFGQLLLDKSPSLLMAEEDLRRDIELLANHEIGTLRVALGPYPSMTSGYAAIARTHALHPRLKVSARVAGWREVAQQVASGVADLGIAELSALQGNPSFTCELLANHTGRLFCRPGHPLLQEKPMELSQLLAYPWVASRIPSRVASLMPANLGAAGARDAVNGDFVPAIELDVPMQIARFLTDSDALALGTLAIFERELLAGEVALLSQQVLNMQSSYGIFYLRERALPPAALAYLEQVRVIEEQIRQREALLSRQLGLSEP